MANPHSSATVNHIRASLGTRSESGSAGPGIMEGIRGWGRRSVTHHLSALGGALWLGAWALGLRSKKPYGTSATLCHIVGKTGQSSGRARWWKPIVTHSTISAFATGRWRAA